jgi:hypothetical protein
MASRRQEFKALSKYITQLRPIGKLYGFMVRGQNGKEVEVSFGGLDNFCGSVVFPPDKIVCTTTNFFALMSLFDKNKISFTEVVRLKGLLAKMVGEGK